MTVRIERTLFREASNGHWEQVRQDEILAIDEPVVILGDPGLGKTELTKALGERPGMRYVHAGTFQRHADPGTLISGGQRIVIDGLDEIASAGHGGSVDAVLGQLSRMGNPAVILSCREADWQGASDRAKIEQDYGMAPVLLHLLPFSYEDTQAFLYGEFPGIDADALLAHLEDRGIESLSENPLTLRMLGEIAEREGELPGSRTQLFDRACRAMLEEKNPLHERDPHGHRTHEELVLAAGAVCAAQLICDRFGVYTGPHAKTPEDCLNVADLEGLPSGDAASDVLQTRLFRAEGENRFTHVHRTFAEYLGAQWLAHCCDKEASERRIFALFGSADAVSTSLRGLYGWLPHFSGVLADRCIAADPNAVLRSGAAETLDHDRARDLLESLKGLLRVDAALLSHRRGRHPASGLMRVQLKDDILGVVTRESRHGPLGRILLEAIPGTDLAPELKPDLASILFERDRYYEVRLFASQMLRAADPMSDWESAIHRLLGMQDRESDLLAWGIIAGIDANVVSVDTVVDAALACLGLAANRDAARKSFPLSLDTRFLSRVDAAWGAKLLDRLTECARPLMETACSRAKAGIADLVRRLTARVIELEPLTGPERVWAWICWLDGNDGSEYDARKRLTAAFRENERLRAAVLEYVLVGPAADRIGTAAGRLDALQLDLYPSAEDLARVIGGPGNQTGGALFDTDTWRRLLSLDRSKEGLPIVLHDAAVAAADGDPELLAIVDDMSDRTALKQRAEEEELEAREQAERRRIRQHHRADFARKVDAVVAGEIEVLELPAEVYLGLRIRPESEYLFEPGAARFGSKETPGDRLCAFLGDELSGRVLEGFVAILSRDDLPSAAEIARINCEGKAWAARLPMLCGIAEMLRRGLEIDEIERATLAATYMALQPLWDLGPLIRMDVRDALEKALFRNEADWEAHFRASIEPRLAQNSRRISGFVDLAYDQRLANLAGRLAVEWLRGFPALSPSRQAELLDCALRNADPQMARELVVDRRADGHADEETRLFWLSADYVADFEDRREALQREAADNPGFLWFIRDRIAPAERPGLNGAFVTGFGLNRLNVAQLTFIVEAFGVNWPATEQPAGATRRDGCDPQDAAEFIEKAIFEIARRPRSEATEALQELSAAGPESCIDATGRALGHQLWVRKEFEQTAPTVEELHAAMKDGLPETIDDMRAWFADRIERLQERIRSSNTDMWEAYWAEAGPKEENYCRDRMIEHLSAQLPESIRLEPEARMPGSGRSDIALTRNAIKLPVEIKGQWHRNIWEAAIDQLDAKYAVDWQAKGRGAYIVLWFGDVDKKQLPAHPDGLQRPQTPEELRRMLDDRLTRARRSLIDVFVVDVSRPGKEKRPARTSA